MEEGVVQDPPFVEEEEEEVVQPLPLPLVEEEEGAVQPPPHLVGVMEEVAHMLERAASCRRSVATGVDDVISRCEEARLKLHEIVAVLVQEPGDAAEILYANLLEVAPHGLDSLLLLDPAAKLVDGLFNWSVNVAMALVSDTFYYPEPEGGPLLVDSDTFFFYQEPEGGALQSARRHLRCLVRFHLEALDEVGFPVFRGGQGASVWVWDDKHEQLDGQGRMAMQKLEVALDRSISAVHAVRLCWMPSRVPTAVLRLQEAISEVLEVLVVLRRMRGTLVQLELSVLNITADAQVPPP